MINKYKFGDLVGMAIRLTDRPPPCGIVVGIHESDYTRHINPGIKESTNIVEVIWTNDANGIKTPQKCYDFSLKLIARA